MSYHDSRRRHPHPIQTFRPESEYSSSAPGSGAQTPTGSGASSSQLPGLVSSIWGGLIRRFSAETPSLTHSQSHPADSSHSHFDDHNYNNSNNNDNNGVDGVYVPPRFHETIQRTASPMQPPPLEPVQLKGFAPDTPASARILTQAIAEEIRIMVPTRLSIVDEWNLVYSLDQDGASLGTLYDKCAKYSGRRVGFVLAVKDAEGGVSCLSPSPSLPPSLFFTFRVQAFPPPHLLSLSKLGTQRYTHVPKTDQSLTSRTLPQRYRSSAPTSPTSPTQPPNTSAQVNVSSGAPPSWPPSRLLPRPTPRTCEAEHPPFRQSERARTRPRTRPRTTTTAATILPPVPF